MQLRINPPPQTKASKNTQYTHFTTKEETEAQRSEVISSTSPRQRPAELGPELKHPISIKLHECKELPVVEAE